MTGTGTTPCRMVFSGLLITRPWAEAEALAQQLSDLSLNIVVQPAHEFNAVSISTTQYAALVYVVRAKPAPWLIFTSPRAVQFALPQLSQEILNGCQLIAIGPGTANALQQASERPVMQPSAGFTSEDLLRWLDESPLQAEKAFIIAAAGGRNALLLGLRQRGIATEMLLMYERRAASITVESNKTLEQCSKLLSVWTSADAMQRLSEGLSAKAWQQICAGEWLVVSQRLAEIATAWQPAAVHLSDGPGNEQLAVAIRKLCCSA